MEVLYHLRHNETTYCGDIPLPSPYIGPYIWQVPQVPPSTLTQHWLTLPSQVEDAEALEAPEAGSWKVLEGWHLGYFMNLSCFPYIWEEQFQLTHMFQRRSATTNQNVSHIFDREAKQKKSLVVLIAGYIPKGAARVCPRRHWKLPNPREAQAPPVLCRIEPGSPE